MKKSNFTKRLLAFLLVLVMTLGYLPVMTNAAELEVSNKVADPQTLHNWQAYYGDSSLLPDGSTGISTWKAGGVWTDKSVFASDADITEAGLPTSLADQNAFLVSLSALASNKEIVGQSSAPTDTFLVLDVSGSMDDDDKAEGMVEAANRAIHTLLKQNKNNRVGVMLYSGTRNDDGATATTVLLPLDHYTTTSTVTTGSWNNRETIPAYLNISDDNSSPDVSIARGVRNDDGDTPTSRSREVVGATYIQRGLYDAWKEFQKVTDTKLPEGNIQAGVQRTPVIILMSDGRPTLATEDYNNVGLRDSEHGNGSEDTTTNKTVFLTQLTAAWVKGAVSDHYGTDAKFYTLGLGTGNDAYATNVLNPSGTTNTNILNWWNNFINGSERSDGTVRVQNSGWRQDAWDLPYDDDRFATGIGRNYTDNYWSAADVSEMIEKFQQIVEQIGLQSAYTATLVQSGDVDMDGYITVEDELGSMMMVKDIKGILLGDTLFTGQELAKSMTEGNLGSTTNPTDYGDEFVATVKERLGVDTSAAQQLIAAAYADNQLYYNAETGAYANYIGWYGDADNNYLGFWDKDTGLVADGAPAGAKYINQSYGFLGGTAGAVGATDMMHIIVMVHTEIATGHQTVLFKVPASLIPMITYKVELEGDSLETAEEITLTVEETDPIRLLYEVGLPDDINEVNLEQKVQEYLAKDGSNHIHKNADGSYTFYANSWGADHGVAPDISELSDSEKQALTASVAESHFIPNTANERFYVLEDSLVYTKSGNTYSVLTSLPVAGGEYYFARTIVNVTGAGGKAEAVTQYEILSDATVANTDNFKIVDGNCIVKEGTIRQTLSDLELAKSENTTDTIGYSDSLWVYVPGSDAEDYNVYSFLGNNGKLTVMPTSGIKVTKDVTELAEGQSADEKFPIVVTLSQASDDLQITDADGNALPANAYTVSADGKVITLQLADGETAYLGGLTVGTTYTVSEEHSKYSPSYIYDNADKTVRAGYIDGVTVTNVPVKNGSLYITKEVVHAHEGETFPTDYEFDFQVTFVDANGDPIANTTFAAENSLDSSLTEVTTNASGIVSGEMFHGETTYIKGIPAGTVVTVEEINIPDNYTVAYRSRNATGQDSDNDGVVTIVSNTDATVVATNTYTPKSTTVDLDIAGTKIFDVQGNIDAQLAGSFTFIVEKWNGQSWVAVENKTATLTYAAGEGGSTKTFSIENVLEGVTFAQAGTYAYQVREQIGSVANVTYDRTLYTFTVTVADEGGQLVATVTDLKNTEITDGSYEVSFTNEFHSAPVSIDIVKAVDDKSDNPLTSKAGFEFVAVQTDENWNPLTGDAASSLNVYSDGAGEARLTATYKTAGSYYYIVTETDAGADGWTYSDAEYKIEVVVTKDETTGDLTATLIVNGVDQESDNTSITFENVYDPTDAEVDLDVVPTVVKKLDGRDLAAGEFTFAIFENGASSFTSTDKAVMVGTNDADGNVSFTATAYGIEKNLASEENNTLRFSQVGTYYFDIVEINSGLGGVTYDTTIYDLVIEVADAGDGTLEAEYYFEDDVNLQVSFNNTYTAGPTEVVIEGQKSIRVSSGLKDLTVGMFTFGLYENDVKIAETTNLANGSFVFDAITYQEPGNHTYTVKEIAPDGTTDGSYKANGMDYAGDAFTVTVEVTDNGEGALSAAVTGNGTGNIHFINIYESIPASVTLSGLKTLTGRDLTAGEFTYAVYESDADFVERTLITDEITHDAEGNITFALGSLGMGYHYFILKEVIPEERAAGIHYDASEYKVTVQVTDGGNGQMSAITTVKHTGDPNAVNPAITFKNIYRPEDTSVLIEGTKVLEGGLPLAADDFSFELYEGSSVLDTATVAADGSFSFDAITYTADDIGEHTYIVKEQIPAGATENADGTWTLGTITYDKTEYTVVVTVTDNAGVLEVTTTISNGTETVNSIVFTNTHTPDPIPLNLEATKEYNKVFGAGKFTFTLEGEGFTKQEKTNDADGKVTFDTLQLTEAKTYTLTVKEKEEILWGFISWDKSEYTVTVTVENQNGVLVITGQTVTVGQEAKDGGIVFNNVYNLNGEDEVVLSGTKTLTGDRTSVNAGEFEFGLYDASGALVESVKNDANGNFAFAPLTFDETDTTIDGENTYVYTVKEIAGTNNGMTYDDAVYTVTVTVKDNDQGGVQVSHMITENGAAAEIAFENTYTITGTGSVAIAGTKTYDGKTLTGNDFTFVLSKGNTELEQVKNAADGTFAFTPISYTKADIGTHTYTVSELRPADAQQMEDGSYMKDGTIYDANIYTVEVTVADNGDGGLTVTKKVNNQAAEEINVAFDNVYQIFGVGQLELEGTKTLTGGKTLADGEFAFGLYEGTQLIAQAENKNGAFQLIKAYTADELGEYTYTVAEILPEGAVKNEDGTWTLGNITYDPAVYTVYVSVVDDQKGGIDVSYDLEDAEAITFENTYTPDDQIVTIEIQKVLDNKTDKQVSLEGFQFEIACGKEVHTTKSDAEGKAGFEVTFSAAHIGQTYEFKVSEKNTGIKGMTYDKTVYTIKVQVQQNEDGTIQTVINDQTADKAAVKFTNVYEELVTPPTGDTFNMILPIALMLLSILGVAAVIITRKKRTA